MTRRRNGRRTGENLVTPSSKGTRITPETDGQADDEAQEAVNVGYNDDATMVDLDTRKEVVVEETKQSPLD